MHLIVGSHPLKSDAVHLPTRLNQQLINWAPLGKRCGVLPFGANDMLGKLLVRKPKSGPFPGMTIRETTNKDDIHY